MKKFTFNLMLFLLPIAIFISLAEFFYRTVPNNYSVKNENLIKKKAEIETLLFGDSHCFYGLNPIYFKKKTFNLSNVSQTIYFDKLLLDKYIKILPKLNYIVICIEYTNLSQKDNTEEDIWRKYYYQSYMNLEVPLIKWYDFNQFFLCTTQNPSRTFDLILKYAKNGFVNDCDTNGWGTNYKKKDRIGPELIAKERAQQQEDGSVDFVANSERIDSIIRFCKQKNIKVVIVSMPQTHLYSSYLNQKKLKLIFKTCQNFQTNNFKDVYYLNLFNENRFSDEDFYDSDHLNEVGAKKCSIIVDEFINSI
jgi:hypothetical protein